MAAGGNTSYDNVCSSGSAAEPVVTVNLTGKVAIYLNQPQEHKITTEADTEKNEIVGPNVWCD